MTINGTTRSIIFANGSSNINISSGTIVCQTISMIFTASNTIPIAVISNVAPYY